MSISSKLQTLAEMDVGGVFVQYLEELRSGPMDSGDGINRPLQQLAENCDALLDVLQAQRSQVILGGGTIAWDSGTGVLSWSADLVFRFAHEIGGSTNNVLAAGNLTLSASGKLAYVKLDRVASAAAVTGVVVPNMAAFVAVLTANSERLDYQVLVYRDGTDLVFGDGRRLRSGYALVGGRDTQYGQQTELTTVRDNEKENFKVILSGGGDITWDSTAVSGTVGTLSWSDSFVVKLPATDGEVSVTGTVVMGKNTKNLEDGDVLYITLPRKLTGASSIAVSKVAAGNVALAGDDVFVLAVREDTRVYFWNGTAISDGETILLGGVRSGLQWFYGEDGPPGGDQVTSFGSTLTYRVGCGELMVYRNGLKARGSTAYWLGVFPSGSLVGTLDANDQYVEEDHSESGTGYRVVWLADDGSSPCGHTTTAHAPGDPFTWPDETDYIESFVGVQGDGPSPVESLGVEGEEETAEGAVKFRGASGVSVSLDGNVLVISLDATAGVTSIQVNGGDLVGGNLQLMSGRLIDVSRDDFDITFDLGIDDDLADALSGTLGNMEGDTDPAAANPLVARAWVLDGYPQLSGFDLLYAPSSLVVQISPGKVLIGNAVYASDGLTTCQVSDLLDGDTLTDAAWHYIYVGVNAGAVAAYLSTTPPSVGGKHPDEDIWFLSSVYYTTAGGFNRFVKRGGVVKLADPIEVTGHGLPAASEMTVNLGSFLPANGAVQATLLIEATQIDVGGATSPYVSYGVSALEYTLYTSKAYDVKVSFVIDTVLSATSYFHCLLPTDDWLHSSATLKLTGYSESQSWGA